MFELLKYLLNEKTKHFIAGSFIGFGPAVQFLFNSTLLVNSGIWVVVAKAVGSVFLAATSGLITALFADIYKRKIGPWFWKVYHKRFPKNKQNGKSKEDEHKAA